LIVLNATIGISCWTDQARCLRDSRQRDRRRQWGERTNRIFVA